MHLFHKHHHQDNNMGVEPAAANRSLNTIRTELEYLRDSGLLNPAQFQSIMNQLPVRSLNTLSNPRFQIYNVSCSNPEESQATTSTRATPKGPTTSTCLSSLKRRRTRIILPTHSIPR